MASFRGCSRPPGAALAVAAGGLGAAAGHRSRLSSMRGGTYRTDRRPAARRSNGSRSLERLDVGCAVIVLPIAPQVICGDSASRGPPVVSIVSRFLRKRGENLADNDVAGDALREMVDVLRVIRNPPLPVGVENAPMGRFRLADRAKGLQAAEPSYRRSFPCEGWRRRCRGCPSSSSRRSIGGVEMASWT